MNIEVKDLDIKKDDRGWLAEILRPEDVGVKDFGQILVTVANPGQVKGNHYHKRKVEWFCVIEGDMEVHLLDVKTGEHKVVLMGESNPVLLKILPGTSHAIKNTGDKPAVLLIYISESYDPEDADTFPKEVLSSG